MVAHAYNPSTLGGWGGWITRSRDWDHPGQRGETPSLLKIQKISWAWWRVPVIPATQEAEAGELPEPRRRRLRWDKMVPLHSSLGYKSETPSQKKKKEKWGRMLGSCWKCISCYSRDLYMTICIFNICKICSDVPFSFQTYFFSSSSPFFLSCLIIDLSI